MKIVFLDRDGVINRFPGYGGYVTRVKDFHFLPGALAAIKTLTEMGYTLFVISNQAGVSRGVYSEYKLNQITNHMLKEIRRAGGKIKSVLYCIHASNVGCDCRKPNIGSIKKAMQLVNKTLRHTKKSFFIGDAESDIEAGRTAGCKTIFVLSGKDKRRDLASWKIRPDHVSENLLRAVKIIRLRRRPRTSVR